MIQAKLIEQIGEDYGIIVASEMCDLGARLRFPAFMPEEPIDLHLRLPEKYLALFIDTAQPLIIRPRHEAESGSVED